MILTGNCLDILPTLAAESVDSIVTDPPYGLKFMGKSWDHGIPGAEFWQSALRVAKPGAYLLAFGGTRTHHRLTCAIEDAGWEIRDCIMWVYSQGFPKSLDVSKAIDKAAGAERVILGTVKKTHIGGEHSHEAWSRPSHFEADGVTPIRKMNLTAPATDAAHQWEGWGTALKPAWEPIIVARKPLAGTVAANVLQYGTGAMNIDGCRVETEEGGERNHHGAVYEGVAEGYKRQNKSSYTHKTDWKMQPQGRWPANLIHDGSEEVLALFPQSSGQMADVPLNSRKTKDVYGEYGHNSGMQARGDSGSAARFFYCAKASKEDRNEGCDKNTHPTVKPTALMVYLCRLVTPPGGTVLDMFCGSGSTGKAAEKCGFEFIGIDEDPQATEISEKRVDAARLPLFGEVI